VKPEVDAANPHFTERTTCPVCDSGDLVELYRCPYTVPPLRDFLVKKYSERGSVDFSLLQGADYRLMECGSCSLVFQTQIPDAELAEIVYERWTDPARSLHHKEKGAVRARGRYAMEIMAIVEFLRRKPESIKVLDFGMGWGYWVRMAQAFGCQAFGLETSRARIEHAEAAGLNVLSLEDLSAHRFDFINTEQVFEHLPDPSGTASELAARLTERGILKISVPNARNVKRAIRGADWTAGYRAHGSMKDVSPLQHINAFNHRSLMRLAERAGLERVPIPPGLRYRYLPAWEGVGELLRRTVGQHYRSVRRQETVVWLRRRH
jgi:SAM-dependent methyltransferase